MHCNNFCPASTNSTILNCNNIMSRISDFLLNSYGILKKNTLSTSVSSVGTNTARWYWYSCSLRNFSLICLLSPKKHFPVWCQFEDIGRSKKVSQSGWCFVFLSAGHLEQALINVNFQLFGEKSKSLIENNFTIKFYNKKWRYPHSGKFFVIVTRANRKFCRCTLQQSNIVSYGFIRVTLKQNKCNAYIRMIMHTNTLS